MNAGRLILVAAMLAGGCTIDKRDNYDPDVVLSFQPVCSILCDDTPAVYPESQPFGVAGWSLPEDMPWASNAGSSEIFVSPSRVSSVEKGIWTMDDGILWPSKDRNLSVMAWSPYEAGAGCDTSDGVSFNGVDVSEDQTDLLYTEPQCDLDKRECGGVAPLPFHHALCMVEFRVGKSVNKTEDVFIHRVAIEAAGYKGDFRSLPYPAWKVGADRKEFVFYEAAEGESFKTKFTHQPIGRSWLMLPQKFETKVVVDYSYRRPDNTGLDAKLGTRSLETQLQPGKHYTYDITVDIDDVNFKLEIIEERLNK